MKIEFTCEHCGGVGRQWSGSVNRARRSGLRLFCGRTCAGLARRKGRSEAQKVEEKRLYDQEYRAKNIAQIKENKRVHYQATRDPEKEKIIRQARMPLHVEYCRRPEYKAKKREYDRRVRAAEFGPFAESWLLLQDLNAEIASRMSRYDIYMANGRFEKYSEKRKQRRMAI